MADPAGPSDESRRQGKSAAAFRTISEVSTELDVPAHVLRFWESKFAQVKPLKRGGGRRYYRPEDIDLLRGIRELLYTDGYTIKGVQKLLRDGGVKAVVAPGDEDRAPAASPRTGDALDPSAVKEPWVMPPPREGGGLGERQRAELTSVLRELEDLRALLRQ